MTTILLNEQQTKVVDSVREFKTFLDNSPHKAQLPVLKSKITTVESKKTSVISKKETATALVSQYQAEVAANAFDRTALKASRLNLDRQIKKADFYTQKENILTEKKNKLTQKNNNLKTKVTRGGNRLIRKVNLEKRVFEAFSGDVVSLDAACRSDVGIGIGDLPVLLSDATNDNLIV